MHDILKYIVHLSNELIKSILKSFKFVGTDGTQGAISVVRVGHEGKPDDATDSENEDEKLQHVTLSVDSYYGEPNSIIKYGKTINVI